MRYVKVTWHHDFPDEPIHYFHEVGEDNYETRRVQTYRDGHTEWADETHETPTAGVAEIPIAPIEEITSQPEFDAEEITQEEFEQQWTKARQTPH
ncbi:DUF6881 domain-containing protein [Nocardia pneumoniae]|uniref:DUF6881 domain-containing protein n=1 Tax=Nocardia pneumoniae TaxID=228601 RepID=UPI0002E38D0A|nr:hypothetical protein [Nocardia pneumoniae]